MSSIRLRRSPDLEVLVGWLRVPVGPWTVVAGAAALCVAQCLIVPAFYDYSGSLGALGFGFGERSEAVLRTGSLWVCEAGRCSFATRMPLMPYVYAGAAKLLGDNLWRIAVFKTAFLDLFLLYFLSRFLAIFGADRFTLGVVLLAFAGPQFMLHGFSPHYEEGFLIPLLAVLMILQLVLAMRRERDLPRWARLPAYGAASAAVYLVKSSMILVTGWCLVFVFLAAELQARARARLALALCLVPLVWGVVVTAETGHFALGSSIDGFNLFGGNNPVAADFYPYCTTDCEFGEGPVEVGGRMVERLNLGALVEPIGRDQGRDEWDTNAAFLSAALRWALANPGQESMLLARKLGVFFFDVRNWPKEPGQKKPPRAALVAGMVWMLAMRGLMWAAIGAALFALVRDRERRTAGAAFLMVLGCYALPYILGFGFERHVVPILLPAALYLVLAWRTPRSGATALWAAP